MFARFLSRFRRNPGAALRQIGLANEQDRRRAMTNDIRAALRAKGHNLPPIDWATLKGN